MPGLVGVIPNSNTLLEDMINSIKHAEWQKIDKYSDSFFGIGRVHLGTFNPEPQPIFHEDENLCIFMDGEIYDYESEMRKMKEKGHEFRIGNDAEFCLHLYEEFGTNFAKPLNGSFVIIICDMKDKKIIIINDRYGLRPLYYAINNNRLLFASEIKAILQDKKLKKVLNDKAVADFFAFGEILENKTFFKGVKVLPPASVFVYKDRKVTINQYWDFNYEPDYLTTEEEFVDELIRIFKKAVNIRIKDTCHYGISLSGGLDSRSVLAVVDESKKKNVTAYTYGPLDCDEMKIARKVSNKLGVKFKAIEITPEMILDYSEEEVYLSDGLDYIGVSYILPVHEMLRREIDIAFDGFALDLTLGGSRLRKGLRSLNLKDNKDLFDLLLGERHFSDEEMSELFNEEYYGKIKEYPLNSFKSAFNRIKDDDLKNKIDHFALQNHVRRQTIGGHVLTRNAVEQSVPTYDNQLIDLILKIPPELREHHRIYKKFLFKLSPELAKVPYHKTMIRATAPRFLWRLFMLIEYGKEYMKQIIWRISRGKILIPNHRSYVNFDDWLRVNQKWKKFFKELLLGKNTISKKYFNQSYIERLIREHEIGKNNNSMKILYLATFEIFLRINKETKC